jgi:hypothetical protein
LHTPSSAARATGVAKSTIYRAIKTGRLQRLSKQRHDDLLSRHVRLVSLNRPGGNVTGATFLSIELGAKRLEL